MADEKILKEEELSQDQLDEVAGGTREEFNEICKWLGKSPTFNTRDGIRKLLMKNYNIEVAHWNTGDWGSAKNAPAEFWGVLKDGSKVTLGFEDVEDIIKGRMTVEDFYTNG